jgi:hypothetical protein
MACVAIPNISLKFVHPFMQTYRSALELHQSVESSLQNSQKRLLIERLKEAKAQSAQLLEEISPCDKPDINMLTRNVEILQVKMNDYKCDPHCLRAIKMDIEYLESKFKSYKQLYDLHQINLVPDLKLAKLEVCKLKEHLVISSNKGRVGSKTL